MMKVDFAEYNFKGKDGLDIYGSRYEIDKPKGVILALHGMAEHRKRYDEFANILNNAGYSFYIHDHRGHGETALENDMPLGHFADENGWEKVIGDVKNHRELIENRNDREIPVFLFGHSMGSFVSRDYINRNPDDFSGALLSGAALVKRTELFLLKFFIGLEKLFKGEKKKSTLVENLIFSSNNRSFKDTETPHDWLSRNSEITKKYYEDDRCGFSCTVKFYDDFYEGMKNTAYIENYKSISENFPIIFLSGEKDPVGGKDIIELAKKYKKAGLKNVEHKLYPQARHELINEYNKDDFFEDVINWLDKNIISFKRQEDEGSNEK